MAQTTNASATLEKTPAAVISKIDAVGKALAQLGDDASRPDIQAFVKKAFGLDIGLDHISNCKNELQKRAGKGKTKAKQPAAPKAAVAPAKGEAVNPTAPKTSAPKPAAAVGGKNLALSHVLSDPSGPRQNLQVSSTNLNESCNSGNAVSPSTSSPRWTKDWTPVRSARRK